MSEAQPLGNLARQERRISRTNNFDLLRFLLAALVVVHHTYVLARTEELKLLEQTLRPMSRLAVPGFFVISGFLVFMSYETSKSLGNYFEKRSRRILPAYWFSVIACAIFGSFLSTLPWYQYFNKDWLRYLFSNLVFLNFTHPSLPGVFEHNPYQPVVNGSLWTTKVELSFYVAVPLIIFLMRRFNKLFLLTSLYILSFIYREILQLIATQSGHSLWFQTAEQLPGNLMFFLGGAILYYYFDDFKRVYKYVLPIALAILIVSTRSEILITNYYKYYFLTPIAVAVVVISIAFFTPYTNFFSKHGDLSYGMYIYHWPISQALISYGLFKQNAFIAFVLLIMLTIGVSYCSWHFLEKPCIQKKQVKV